jgi:hypothetical protein
MSIPTSYDFFEFSEETPRNLKRVRTELESFRAGQYFVSLPTVELPNRPFTPTAAAGSLPNYAPAEH